MWTKLHFLSSELEQCRRGQGGTGSSSGETTWLFWVDNDAFFMNHSISLESVVHQYAADGMNAHLLITADWNGINAGKTK